MQVLVKNPLITTELTLKDVGESFWSEDCLYLGPNFSMASLMDSSKTLKLSPFLVIDAKIAFMISQLAPGSSLLTRNLGPLGTMGAHLMSGSKLVHQEDPKKFSLYVEEYLPKDKQQIISQEPFYDQVITFGESQINPDDWKKLKTNGLYIMGGKNLKINLDHTQFEAFGKLWPCGEATEFGWKFNEENQGLVDFEFCKLKKLG